MPPWKPLYAIPSSELRLPALGLEPQSYHEFCDDFTTLRGEPALSDGRNAPCVLPYVQDLVPWQ
jgi:hypothetical protein